jgi:D-serine deaminase-like pyridoxal phosphate-dependent protein
MSLAKQGCITRIGHCEIVSSGGTPSMKSVRGPSVITEYRPGTYIYNDKSLIARGACGIDDCAMSISATVVSRPTPNRVIIDAGSKTLSSDLLGLHGYGMLRDYPAAIINGLSEEHGHIDVKESIEKPKIGEKIFIIPNHACVVTNLFNEVHLHRSGQFIETVHVDARGCVF